MQRSRDPAEIGAGVTQAAPSAAQAVEPLRLSVPAAGVRYRFEKLYANRAGEEARFSMPYASGGGATLTQLLAAFGT